MAPADIIKMMINIFSTQIPVNKKGSFFLKVVFEINRNKMSAVRVVSSSFSSQKKKLGRPRTRPVKIRKGIGVSTGNLKNIVILTD